MSDIDDEVDTLIKEDYKPKTFIELIVFLLITLFKIILQ